MPVILSLLCPESVGQDLEDAENQRSEDSEGLPLLVPCIFGGGVQVSVVRAYGAGAGLDLGGLAYVGKEGIGCGGGRRRRKIKSKDGCVFERVMVKFRGLNVEIRGCCFL